MTRAVRQPRPILQAALIDPPWSYPKGTDLPGTAPVARDDWLRVDDAFAGQMALRDRLIAEHRAQVIAARPEALEAAQELLVMALAILPGLGFRVAPATVTRPDGIGVPIDTADPLATLGRLVQEDLCLHLKPAGASEHILAGAVLCFPASWTLTEKLGRPLSAVHRPVAAYDGGLARRVQRLFDGLRPGVVLRRGNCLSYDGFALFTPQREDAPRQQPRAGQARYLRSERQCLFKLPKTQAVAFSIHTCVVERSGLTQEAQETALAHL